MGAPRYWLLQAALVALTASTAAAQDCQGIQDPKARLECFDKAAKKPAQKPKGDPVLAQAKSTVTAKLRDPGSAQFGPMARKTVPNMRGEPTDIVCGTVNAKNAFGGYVGMSKFVYFVARKEANIMGSDWLDNTVVNNFCKP